MSFFNALVNPFFWTFTVVAGGLLAAAWGVLTRQQRLGQPGEEWQRLLWSWTLLAGVSTAGVLLGREGFALVVGLLALFACKEFARATGLYEDWLFTGMVYVSILVVNVVAQWPGYDAFMATPIYAVALFCLLPVVRDRSGGMLQRVALSVMAFVYFGYFLAHLSLLASVPDPGRVYAYLFFVLYGTATADLAGWLAGRWLGRRPLLPRISRELTREGAAASLAWAGLWSFTLGGLLPDFPWPAMLLSTLLFGIMGPLGDLVMRYILRDLGLKPPTEGDGLVQYLALGHLHRLIFVAPLFFRLIHWFDPDVLVRGSRG
jgi:phosphatidate cytidylyltransferase